ncbi:GNAT family N-acetyltransferase [Streptomyces sp. NPDC058989]|uniref:GNAT family N-acetyltransferase n=1 Tax=Streptomyces sp. NPDC058989 TaxID=3346686 RepID=UPI0036796B67
MTLTVRDFRPADAKSVADLRRAGVPYRLSTPQGVAWEVSTARAAQRLRLFVAELDGRIVGSARAALLPGSHVPGRAAAALHVHPGHRGRGAGRALLAAAEEHLAAAGADRVFVRAVDEPGAHAFARRHGYRHTRTSATSASIWRRPGRRRCRPPCRPVSGCSPARSWRPTRAPCTRRAPRPAPTSRARSRATPWRTRTGCGTPGITRISTWTSPRW